MNEMGIIYHGAYDDISERNWNYGQVRETEATAQDSFKSGQFVQSFSFSSLTMEYWMPVCTSWTGLRCPSPTEETPLRWPEKPLPW